MPVASQASLPAAYVTSVPGRFAPTYVRDKRAPASQTNSSASSSMETFLPRAESVGMDFQTPTTTVSELGTSYNVGEFDSLPDSKVSISSYDVGCGNLSLLVNKKVAASGETDFDYTDLSSAANDIVVTYADPTGAIFYSEYMPDLVFEKYAISLKNKSAAMESFDLVGPLQLGFRGFFITKAYVVQSADVTAHGFTIAPLLGSGEGAVALPVPSGGQPANIWVQRGCINFLKVARWRPATGWTRFTETSSGSPAVGTCKGTVGGVFTFNPAAGELQAGDLFHITFASYKTNVTNYATIPLTSLDTSDPYAIDTRLTPMTINAGNIDRGQGLDLAMSLKRDRVEGIGDPNALYAPPSQPDASISLDVKFTGGSIDTLARTGLALGTDGGNTVAGDFIDSNYETRVMLGTPTPILATLTDPRNAGYIVKQVKVPQAVFKSRSLQMQSKSDVSLKFSGSDQIGNIRVGFNQGAACAFS